MVANNQPETQQTKPACLLAIDPGLSYTGYGLYQMSDLDPKQSAHLINYGVIKGGKSKGINKAPAIWGIMLKMMLVTKPFSFVIEMPEVHKSRKGQQAMQKGSTTKLAFLVGGLVHAYYVHTRGDVTPPLQRNPTRPHDLHPHAVEGEHIQGGTPQTM